MRETNNVKYSDIISVADSCSQPMIKSRPPNLVVISIRYPVSTEVNAFAGVEKCVVKFYTA